MWASHLACPLCRSGWPRIAPVPRECLICHMADCSSGGQVSLFLIRIVLVRICHSTPLPWGYHSCLISPTGLRDLLVHRSLSPASGVNMQTLSWPRSASQAICICFRPSFFWHRYKQEQARVQDELFQVVTREREAATKHRSASLQRGEGSVDQEKRKSAQLVSTHLPELAFCASAALGGRGQAPEPDLSEALGPGFTSAERVSFRGPGA